MKPMYLLDTCILSEPVKKVPLPMVLEKMKKHEGLMVISAIVWHEMLYGVNRLDDGARKKKLSAYLLEVIAPTIPVIPYDEHAAWIHATIRADMEKRGLPLSFANGQIAGTALANNLILVTRNTADFQGIHHLYMENWGDG